jgi:hypothetical protein
MATYNSREIGRLLLRLADLLDAEVLRNQAFKYEGHSELQREAMDIRDLANDFYEAKSPIDLNK